MPVVSIPEFAIRRDARSTANYDAMSERTGASASGWDEEAGVFRILGCGKPTRRPTGSGASG